MKKVMLCLLILLAGCFTSDELLLREMRKDLVESVRPGLVDAMDKAVGPDGEPIYVDAYRNEKVNLVDRMILSVDKLYPPVDENGNATSYTPEPFPWAASPNPAEEAPAGETSETEPDIVEGEPQ